MVHVYVFGHEDLALWCLRVPKGIKRSREAVHWLLLVVRKRRGFIWVRPLLRVGRFAVIVIGVRGWRSGPNGNLFDILVRILNGAVYDLELQELTGGVPGRVEESISGSEGAVRRG